MDADKNNDFTNYSGENLENRKDIFDNALLLSNSPGYTAPFLNSLRGLRILGRGPAMMPLADDTIGLMLITRPQLDLSDDNISKSEKLISMYGGSQYNLSSFIRGTLDERWGAAHSPIGLNNKSPFITCLTEYLKVSTGFSDLQMRVETTEPGIRDQVYQRVASKLEENGSYTMSQTYYNPKGSVIQTLFHHWMTYISEVVSGDRQCGPRDWYLLANRIDFDCRIYHLIMNKDAEFLEHIYATVQSIPTSFPAGSVANIDNTQTTLRGEGQDDFSVQFSSTGMRFDEWGLIQSFNEHTFAYNPRLKPAVRNQYYRELSSSEYSAYNYGAYPLLLPRINESKGSGSVIGERSGIKLTWWVEKT